MKRCLFLLCAIGAVVAGCNATTSEGAEMIEVICDQPYTTGSGQTAYFGIHEFPGRTWWDLAVNVSAYGLLDDPAPVSKANFGGDDYFGSGDVPATALGFADGKIAVSCHGGSSGSTRRIVVRR